MTPRSIRHFAMLGLGLIWGLLCGVILPATPLQILELGVQDSLMRQRGPQPPPSEILLVSIDGQIAAMPQTRPLAQTATTIDFFPDRANYASLVLRLLAAEAKVVVLNLPSGFGFPQSVGVEDLDTPLRQVVQQHADRLVLTAYASRAYNLPLPQLPIYNHFLPFTATAEYQVRPETVQGFVEFNPDADSQVRRASLVGDFIRGDNLQVQTFGSAAVLALEKAARRELPVHRGSAQFNFWGPVGSFASLPIESLCLPNARVTCSSSADLAVLERVRNKIVLVGFTGGYPEAFPSRTPFDNAMPAVEVQANLLASLMTHWFYQKLPAWLGAAIVLSGSIAISWQLATGEAKSGRWLPGRGLVLNLGLSGGYVALSLLAFGQRLILPLALPLLAWVGTAVSVTVCLLVLRQQRQMAQQQRELERLQLAEREAVRYQARKLLYRVATDIHDRQLQDLKLVMDLVETLQLEHPDLVVDPILDKLERIGRGIRNELNNARSLAAKLGVTPALRAGLHRGIQIELQHLGESGELTLKVLQDIQPLTEPQSDSAWIDAREDIFRFFREATTNVLRHAQPPHGTATQVLVSLRQKGSRCTLMIENDGQKVGEEAGSKQSRSGYGTKAMNTIAAELPDGFWRRLPLAGGGVRVELIWTLRTEPH